MSIPDSLMAALLLVLVWFAWKLEQIHSLVNSRLTAALDEIVRLEKALANLFPSTVSLQDHLENSERLAADRKGPK